MKIYLPFLILYFTGANQLINQISLEITSSSLIIQGYQICKIRMGFEYGDRFRRVQWVKYSGSVYIWLKHCSLKNLHQFTRSFSFEIFIYILEVNYSLAKGLTLGTTVKMNQLTYILMMTFIKSIYLGPQMELRCVDK